MANPLQQASVRRKVYYLAAILGLFTVSMFWRGKIPLPLASAGQSDSLNQLRRLASDEREWVEQRLAKGESVEGFDRVMPARGGVQGVADWLQSRTIEDQATPHALDLRELDQGDPEVAGTAARLSLIGARGAVLTILWKMAIDQQRRNEFQEFELLVRIITRLQPNFISPWLYQSWNIAYNVSVENDRLNDMYFYISRGIELAAEGERVNKNNPDLRYFIAFCYQNKFGVSDKVSTLRSLMQVSCIKPQDRDPKKLLRRQDGSIDMVAYQEFCTKNPQLVRRLKEKLKCRLPEEVVQFLEDNYRVPCRYDRDTNLLAEDRNQFPALPKQFSADEFHPRSENVDDSFDAFHAARAWYEYAQLVVPPPNPEPTGVIMLTGGDRFKYRIPKSPAIIIFRQGPPRAQTYLAERLAKEGWFDPDTKWYPDERADTEEERWFPRSSAADLGPGTGLMATTSSYPEWRRAYDRWKRHGEQNGLVLNPAQLVQYQRDASGVPEDPNIIQLTDDQLARLNLTRAQVRAKHILRTYDTNRHMTNFPYFLAASEAESDRETVAAREALWRAERMVAVSKPRAIELYAEALARWRGVLVNYPKFHVGEGQVRSDRTEEETYEHVLALTGLLEKSERIESLARRRLEAARALAPFGIAPSDEDRIRSALAQQIAEHEAGMLVAAADPRVRQRVGEVMNPFATILSASAMAAEPLITRAVIEKDFNWLPEYKSPEKIDTNVWVTAITKGAVRERLGLSRLSSQATPPPPGAPVLTTSIP